MTSRARASPAREQDPVDIQEVNSHFPQSQRMQNPEMPKTGSSTHDALSQRLPLALKSPDLEQFKIRDVRFALLPVPYGEALLWLGSNHGSKKTPRRRRDPKYARLCPSVGR